MSEFKVGDTVKRINTDLSFVKVGVEYTVTNVSDRHIMVFGSRSWYWDVNFVLVKRGEQL